MVITGQLVRAPSQNRMPERTRAFFTKLDRNKDNRVSLEELQAGFEREFKGSLREHAKQEIATLFEAHAQAEGGYELKFKATRRPSGDEIDELIYGDD